jgi:hypothetical protein
MLAVKKRRASEYVPHVAASQPSVVVALAGDVTAEGVASPARMLQDQLAARLAGDALVQPERSLRWRAAVVFGAAILCWLPIAGAAALIFV